MRTSIFFTAIALIPFAMSAPSRRPSFYPRQNCENGTADTTTPDEPTESTTPLCDLSGVQQPHSSLPPPTADMSLVLVALGQGTQNYTCSNATAIPSSIGAVAQLFNASCELSSNPTAGTASLGSIEETASIGAHFFLDNTTPDFDILGLGNTVAKKIDDVPAPDDATKNVKWLRLEAQTGSSSDVKMVYRLNTVGGMAPASCAGMAPGEVVTVEYEAQYWIYT
ncbi:hypothetical protein CC77DRAFT_1057196 [Alternaria alternata]|uniref:Malate dehydrogenase n=1 Tax=Alternaria alternata TaxID=5599 RepID=A0A177E0C1_ALTAL|nr:hypothetical protein CC77DRAFT_1057196 [Alternaria alternata]OAG25413.1 hypothetical protein CC77DRAFT_1057196 [Alternaria alternata]